MGKERNSAALICITPFYRNNIPKVAGCDILFLCKLVSFQGGGDDGSKGSMENKIDKEIEKGFGSFCPAKGSDISSNWLVESHASNA